MRKLKLLIIGIASISAFAFLPASNAWADAAATVGVNQIEYCHGGNCALGDALAYAQIRQWRCGTSNASVCGTEAQCGISKISNVTRVQVDRTALGVVNGPALWVDDTDHNSGTNDFILNTQPSYGHWMNTLHLSTSNNFNIRVACQFSIRWTDGTLTSGLVLNSFQSNGYECLTDFGYQGPPCADETGPTFF